MVIQLATPEEQKLLDWAAKKAKTPEEIEGRVIAIFSEAGLGKTVLACKLGNRILLITDEMNGATSLANHTEFKGRIKVLPFVSHRVTGLFLKMVEEGTYLHDDGEPFDTIVIDTVSGQIAVEIQNIRKSGLTGEKGRLSKESVSQPDYGISEKRVLDLMGQVANLTRVTTILLSHQKVGDKLTPGANTRIDVHAAAFRVINKYASVMAYMTIEGKQRKLQVMPNGNGVAVKTRHRFPSEFVTDDEFIAEIEKWKKGNK